MLCRFAICYRNANEILMHGLSTADFDVARDIWWITNLSNQRRVGTANLLNTMQLPNPLGCKISYSSPSKFKGWIKFELSQYKEQSLYNITENKEKCSSSLLEKIHRFQKQLRNLYNILSVFLHCFSHIFWLI